MTDSIAVVAAHPDDEVLGCGGTLARAAAEGRAVHVLLVADGETSRARSSEKIGLPEMVAARKAAAEKACGVLACASVSFLDLPDNRLDGLELLALVQPIEAFLEQHRPSTVMTHHAGDVNIDHRVVHDAVITACRPQPRHPVKELLFFEIPSSTEWRPPTSAETFHPNWFVDVSATLEVKLQALNAYQTELRPFPHPRSKEAVKALAQWRGATAGLRAAEAFVLGRKISA